MGAALAPMRQRITEYEARFNEYPEGGIPQGVLTVDGVHPCQLPKARPTLCSALSSLSLSFSLPLSISLSLSISMSIYLSLSVCLFLAYLRASLGSLNLSRVVGWQTTLRLLLKHAVFRFAPTGSTFLYTVSLIVWLARVCSAGDGQGRAWGPVVSRRHARERVHGGRHGAGVPSAAPAFSLYPLDAVRVSPALMCEACASCTAQRPLRTVPEKGTDLRGEWIVY